MEGPNDEWYIMKGYTKDQASQDKTFGPEDVIQAKNLVWYTWAERRAWQEKTTAVIPTYSNCTNCYWGPVGMVCMDCEGRAKKTTNISSPQGGRENIGLVLG